MPPIRCGGNRFLLISADDLTFVAAPLAVFDSIWLLVVTSEALRSAAHTIHLKNATFVVDTWLTVPMLVLDILIAGLSAQGGIMQQRRYPRWLCAVTILRFIVHFPSLVIYYWAACFLLTTWWSASYHVVEETDHGGWGYPCRSWETAYFLAFLLLCRLAVMTWVTIFVAALIVPRETKVGAALLGTSLFMVRFMSDKEEILESITNVLFDILGQGTMDIVAPSDMAFGLLLVAARQHQGPLKPLLSDFEGLESDEDFEESEGRNNLETQWLKPALDLSTGLSPSTVRASVLQGMRQRPTPLSSSNEQDLEVLQRITHFLPFAMGMYGFGMEVFASSTYPHSSVVSPARHCRALHRALCCCSQPAVVDETAEVEGDVCCRLNENALRRSLRDGAQRERAMREPTLLWATWKNRGVGTSPPVSVSLDHGGREVVIAFRGTMDIKDAVADAAARPHFFDPFGEAGPTDRRKAPFDDEIGFFAHGTMVRVAEDAVDRLVKAGVLEEALRPGGAAAGWGVVCVGHSLGAGVACLVAMMFHGRKREEAGIPPGVAVRYVGFEPPGGLLSKRLAIQTSKLGFVAAVCANDWISRLSVRAMQIVRENLLDELADCDRSKVQLTLLVASRVARFSPLLCCLRRPISKCLERLGGGRLPWGDNELGRSWAWWTQRRESFSKVRQELHAKTQAGGPQAEDDTERAMTESLQYFSKLWPPSKIVYFRPVTGELWCCGKYEVNKEWVAEWAEPEDLHEFIVSARSVELHLPNIIRDAYYSAAVRIGAVDPSSDQEEEESGEDGRNMDDGLFL